MNWSSTAVQDIDRVRDVHATILQVMGLNDIRLTYYYAGRNRRLTDTGGKTDYPHPGLKHDSFRSVVLKSPASDYSADSPPFPPTRASSTPVERTSRTGREGPS